jgi:hypothetical protein
MGKSNLHQCHIDLDSKLSIAIRNVVPGLRRHQIGQSPPALPLGPHGRNRARSQSNLIAIAQIIAFGHGALGSLSLSMAGNLSLSMA